MSRNRAMRGVAVAAGLATCAMGANGQSLNVDLDTPFSPPLGGGPPSNSFGGAANQPGRWTSVSVAGDADWLYDLEGNVRNIALRVDSPSHVISGGGFNNPANTGDFARLLNDASHVGFEWATWTFEGLTNGTYIVTTYAVSAFPQTVDALITVNGGPTLTCSGPMPGNSFVQGATHVTHTTNVIDGRLTIRISPRNPSTETVFLNGMQITAVPEPGTLIFSTFAAFGYLALRRSRQR